MTNPFKMDPFAYVWEAFHNLYPGKECECYLATPEDDGTGHPGRGIASFEDDGGIIVLVDPTLSVQDAVEVLAHELAHVAVGPEEGHREAWEEVFEAIHQEYDRLVDIYMEEDESS